jgi:hypothetical protein
MPMHRVMIQLPGELKAKLLDLRAQGVTARASFGVSWKSTSASPRWGGKDGEIWNHKRMRWSGQAND